VEEAGTSGTEKGNIYKIKVMSAAQPVKTKTLDLFTGITECKKVTSLELTW
jgi:hypothetical protein